MTDVKLTAFSNVEEVAQRLIDQSRARRPLETIAGFPIVPDPTVPADEIHLRSSGPDGKPQVHILKILE